MNEPNLDTKELIYRKVKTTIKLIEEKDAGEKGIIEAYVSIFNNIDLVGDTILPGAFTESLQKKLPKGVWMHNWDEPIAKTLEAREDAKGLYIKGKLIMDVQKAKEAYILMKEGVIDEFSIGFRILDDEWREDGVRVIKKIRLYEWSPVLAGANPDTELINVKDDNATKTDEKAEIKTEVVKVDYVKATPKGVTVYFSNGTKQEHMVSYKYSKYLSASLKGQKVESIPDAKQVLRIRQAVKQIDKASEYILRITK